MVNVYETPDDEMLASNEADIVSRALQIVENEDSELNGVKRGIVKRLSQFTPKLLTAVTALAMMVGFGHILRGRGDESEKMMMKTGIVKPAHIPEVNKPSLPEPTPTGVPETYNSLEIPEDVVSYDELENTYHTRIWNLPDTQLYLRQHIVDHMPVFQRLKEGSQIEGVTKQFEIVLVDGPFVNSSYLTEEQKQSLPEMVKYLEVEENPFREQKLQQIEAEKPSRIASYQQQLADLNARLQSGAINQDDFNIQSQILEYEYWPYIHEPREKDLIFGHGLGLSFRQDEPDPNNANQFIEHRYVLVAMRGPERIEFRSGDKVVYGQSGLGAVPLDKSQSYLDISEFPVDQRSEYPLGESTPATELMHELQHASGIHEEPEADYATIDYYKRAYEALQAGDDSQYPFVFVTPSGVIISFAPTPFSTPV